MDNKPLVIGTRGSRLALWQAEAVRSALMKKTQAPVEIKVIETRGDRQLQLSLSNHKLDKGLFTRELEAELRSGEVDFAVHSLKDMPVEEPEGLVLAGVLPRGDARDAVVARPGLDLQSVRDLAGLKVGTGSPRRTTQLYYLLWPDTATIVDIRGNVPTRIQKVLDGDYDATILAYAGLERLELLEHISLILPLEAILPAPGQGAVAIQCSRENRAALDLARSISDAPTMQATDLERRILQKLGGGCALPLGIYCHIDRRGIHHINVAYAHRPDAEVIRHQYLLPSDYKEDALDAICRDLTIRD